MLQLQKFLYRLFQSSFRIVETVAPMVARRWATRLFVRPMKYKRPMRELAFLRNAASEVCEFPSTQQSTRTTVSYIKYSWGVCTTTVPASNGTEQSNHNGRVVSADATPVVLLVHGWAGRGSQLATFTQPLLDTGYHVVTFDAPAHGDSPGKETNLIEVSEIICNLSDEYGGFAAIIGHSFGGMAAGYALCHGAKTELLVTIGSPATLDFVLSDFAHQVNGSPAISDAVATYITETTGLPTDTFSLTHTLANSQLPGLILHGEDDKDVPVAQAHLLDAAWPAGQLQIVSGVGHRRILRDEATISQVVAFIAAWHDNRIVSN